MAKNRFLSHPPQQTPAMSPPHPHTVDAAAAASSTTLTLEDEEDDICPLCIGECVCHERLRSEPQSLPLPARASTSRESNSSPAIASSSQTTIDTTHALSPELDRKQPILKIKLTLPPSMLGKRKAKTSSQETLRRGTDTDTPSVPSKSVSQDIFSKRRGRPPKALVAARRAAHAQGHPLPSSASRNKRKQRSPPKKFQSKVAVKQTQPTRKKLPPAPTNDSSELSELTDEDDIDDSRPLGLPTFVEASAIESSADESSASDSVSFSGFDSGSEIEAEEESFIRAEEKARVRRELLYQGRAPLVPPRRDRPRSRQSAGTGTSDVSMEDDSEATEEEDEEEEEEADEEEEEETDGRSTRWVGVATTWSDNDSEESSFDADLFFANLEDSEDEVSHSSCSSGNEGGEDGDQSDLDDVSIGEAAASILPHLRRDLQELPFEITEGWDGQIIFTSGSLTAQDVFRSPSLPPEPTSPLATEPPPTESPSQDSEDVEMAEGFTTEDEEGFIYSGDGDTTDEDLVGNDGLPNAKAMQIFNTPFKDAPSVNPLSTMSPTVSSMAKFRKTPRATPRPTDILAGRVFWNDPDDHEEEFDVDNTKVASSSKDGTPRKGQFEIVDQKRRTVIDGTSNGLIPCAFPRRRPRGKSLLAHSHSRSHDQADMSLRKALVFPRPGSLPPSSVSSLHMLSSSDLDTSHSDFPGTQPIELDDVLDSSFLDSEPPDYFGNATTSAPVEGESRKHMRNLSRWDLISVGAFRKTTEAGNNTNEAGWGSDSATDYGTVMRSSPLTPMMWHNKSGLTAPKPSREQLSVDTASSSLLPLQDGDRTPTNGSSQPQTPQRENKQTRREQRKERKLQRKSHGHSSNRPQHQQHQHHNHHRFHQHQHVPNFKTRSTSSLQRNFSSPAASASSMNA